VTKIEKHQFVSKVCLFSKKERSSSNNNNNISSGRFLQAFNDRNMNGSSSSNDANHISGPSRTGEGLVRSIQKTLEDIGRELIKNLNQAETKAQSKHDKMDEIKDKVEVKFCFDLQSKSYYEISYPHLLINLRGKNLVDCYSIAKAPQVLLHPEPVFSGSFPHTGNSKTAYYEYLPHMNYPPIYYNFQKPVQHMFKPTIENYGWTSSVE
jgi:hypothetical protein